MVLLRKNDAPVGLRDYRPISLIHSFGKLVSKALVLRLAPFMNALVKPNQTAFIKGRRIHDNFRSVNLYCRWLHARHHLCILLKVDIAKAFDSVAWSFLLEVLEHMWFLQCWRDWTASILSSASTKILVNGRLGRRICHARGLRQGDPLSRCYSCLLWRCSTPLLQKRTRRVFCLLCQAMASACGRPRPVPCTHAGGLPLHPRHPRPLRGRIRTNHQPGQVSRLTDLVHGRGRRAGAARVSVPALALSMCYLGTPLLVRRLRHSDEQRLVDAVASRIPTWKGKMMNAARRTTLTRATLFAIPLHMSTTCSLSTWAIWLIDIRRHAFLWSGMDSVAGGQCKVAWPIVCAPRCYGGMGVPDLWILGFALRLRWEWQKRATDAPAWMRLPSRPEKLVNAVFSCSVRIDLEDGASALFWTDS